ncbi:FliA/WhiG family RNA polymerase sigma factor [Bacillus sp. HMF5848]|uniref:FliA/WhiG family RNA polymerase sigma factor n=1 Tax=Bacillus sp. HMF5848 TaxID=2495421 RepID=UPI000F7839CA|nr:FliA/WhiG family RNA polymerase sigma factor [Bacillus sp. HMF5848]RSK27052.1 FliA/WhiG family RNA polymerase sigma factor [Bacillus sp. HMF5848]
MSQLTNDEQIYWHKWIESRDPEAGDVLIKWYMPLVTYHVQRIAANVPKSISIEELKSLGMAGLLDALEKFDVTRELKFDTYASFRIRGAIIDGLRKEDWMSRTTREKVKRIEATTEKLEQAYMRSVSPSEVAMELNMKEDEVISIMNESIFANVLSMDDLPVDDDQQERHNISLKDNNMPTPEEEVINGEKHHELAAGIKKLNEKEQIVLSLFYNEELTLTEIGQVLQLSTSRVSQIHSKALYKLKDILKKDYL